MASIASNRRVLEALNEGYSYEEIRDYAVSKHQEMMANGSTRQEADDYMYNTWGLKSHLSRADADRAEWVASLLFEDQQPQRDDSFDTSMGITSKGTAPKPIAPKLPATNPNGDIPELGGTGQGIDIQAPASNTETGIEIPEGGLQNENLENSDVTPENLKKVPETQNGAPNLDLSVGLGLVPEGQVLSSDKPRRPETRNAPYSQTATSAFESMIAGWQYSGLGLWSAGGLPTYKGPADGALSHALFVVGQMLGDAPSFIIGGTVGSLAGSAVPVLGTAAGASAGAFGTAAYVRAALMQAYEKGEATSFSDLAARWGNSTMAFANDAALGAILPGVNAAVTKAAESAFGRIAMKEMTKGASQTAVRQSMAADAAIAASQFGAEVGTMIAHQSLVGRRLPTMQDAINAGIGLLGIKYFSGGLEIAKTAYVKYNVHPNDLSLLAQRDPAAYQKTLEDATRASIHPQKSVYAIETEGQPKYSERNRMANDANYNEFPWMFVSEKKGEEAILHQMVQDRNPNNPAVIAAKEAKAAYDHQLKVNTRKDSRYQKAKAAYDAAQAQLDKFERGARREDEILQELVNRKLAREDDTLFATGYDYEYSIYGRMKEIEQQTDKYGTKSKMSPPKADRSWAARVRRILTKYEAESQSNEQTSVIRAELQEELRIAKERFDVEQQKVGQLEQAWKDAEKHVPRTTSDTPYRALREINIPRWGATIQLNGLGDKALNHLVNRYFNSEYGKDHPNAKLFKKKGVTKAQMDKVYYDMLVHPTRSFMDFLRSATWSLDELKLLGGKEMREALSKAKPGEVAKVHGQNFAISTDKDAQYEVQFHGIYMDSGYLPINVRSTTPGELDSSKILKSMPDAMKSVYQQINKGQQGGLLGWWNRFYSRAKHHEHELVDRFDKLNEGHRWDGKITPSYLAATEVAPSAGKAERFIEEGMRDWKNNDLLPNRRSLGSIINDREIEINTLDTILLADAGLNAIQTGSATFIKKADALAIMSTMRKSERWSQYNAALKAVRQFNSDLIDYARDSGLITKAKAEELHGLRNTLTVERVVESIGEVNASRTALEDIANALGIKTDSKMSYKDALKKWREENPGVYKSPLRQLIQATMVTVRSAHVNAAKKAIAEDWGVKPKYFSEDKKTAFAEKSSIPLHKMEWKEYGKTYSAWIDPEVYMSVSQLDASSRAISNFLYKWTLDQPANWLRWGTTRSPSFALKNSFIDQFTLGLQTRTEALPMRELGSMLAEIVQGKNGNGSKLFNQWLADGGMSGSFSKYGRNELATLIDSMKKRTWQNTILNPNQKTLSALARQVNPFPRINALLGNISETGEMLPRFREYVNALNKGYSRREAAYLSRTATLDFARAGASIRGLNQIAAFLNAGIQGFDRILRTGIRNPQAFMAKFINQLVIPTLWLSMAEASMMLSAPNSAGADKARDRPDWMRAAFWPVYFGDDYEFCVNIPKPHGVIQLMLLPFEAWIHDAAKNNIIRDPFSAMIDNGLTEALKNSFPNPMDFQATGLKLGAEVITNHQFFTDNAIISSKYEKLAPEERYKESTSGVAFLLGRMLQTISNDTHLPIPQALQSPLVIDHVIRGLGGQLSHQIAQILGDTLPIDKPNVERDWTRNPFVKQFFFQMPNYSAKTFTEFNEVFEKLDQRYQTYKRLASMPNASDRLRALKYSAEGPLLNMNKFRAAMGAQGKMIDMIYHSDAIPASEKGALIDRFMVNQLRIARQGLQLARRIQEQFDMVKED